MTVVLDTGVFFRPEILERLSTVPDDVIVPAVVFAERARQLSKRGIPSNHLLEILEANAFVVEPFGQDEAARYVPQLTDDEAWRKLARDAMIAGHTEAGRVLWTTNPRDFVELGVPEDRIAPC